MAAIRTETELPDRTPPIQVGIFEESHRLRAAAVWGPVGAEAVLAQALPEEISLFFKTFDVPEARREGLRYTQTLQDYGVHIIPVRDRLAALLTPAKSGSKSELIAQLINKTKYFQEYHGTKVNNYGDQIKTLVEQDIERYGEEQAVALNTTLSLDPKLPLGNLIYARDQMNVLLNFRVSSSMTKDIRKPEVALYEQVYADSLPAHPVITIPEGERFEGGDAYIHNGYMFVGVGARTSFGAALKIFWNLKNSLDAAHLKFAIVEDSDSKNRPFGEQQDFMHLDTFSNPIGKKEIAVCEEEATRRRVKFIDATIDGTLTISSYQPRFMDFLARHDDKVIIIPREEQKEFGCNFLLLGKENGQDTVLVPLESNRSINDQLTKSGKNVVAVDLKESTRGYGAAHCMTGQTWRSNE
ncbi:MAG: arginine deiminase family protein [Candidatus Daviesbacteria bacterium]|nr:arginine deiminase family protein [Candidatus Daviesbacteria bacterium]